ncbi:MAG: cytochrome b N-terminal domain-containing protein [Deltaproteobacteria bacterium]|nr:cytochrome b N-terminal domain-containing protein [Deltaproteobacteria bacterium]
MSFRDFLHNLASLPKTFRDSFVRHGRPTTDRTRSQMVMSNVFLHIHSTRIHRYTLRKTFTFGLGIIAAASFFILLVTGVLLMIYYKPSVALAYDSIKDIQFIAPGGRLIRNIHRWATNVMIVSVLFHMARVFYTAAYKETRSFNWLIGIVLFVLTLGLSFTGYLLPWDQLAYWAITIGSNIAASPRELTDLLGITPYFDPGGLMKTLILGSEEIGQEALIRFFWLHCMVLPLALVLFLSAHFWRVRKDGGLSRPDNISPEELEGIEQDEDANSAFDKAPQKTYGLMCLVRGTSPAVGRGPQDTVPSWPTLFVAETALFMLTLAIVCILAYFFNAPLKEIANAAVPENPAKAPWYFLGLQELVSYSAFMGGVGIPSITLLGLALIPYLDREKQSLGHWFDNSQGRYVATASLVYATCVTVAMLVFTVKFGWLRNWFPHISQLVILLINPGTVLVALFAFWSLRYMIKFDSTRIAAIGLFTCFIVSFVILTYFATIHRGPNWGFYWMPSQWPVH